MDFDWFFDDDFSQLEDLAESDGLEADDVGDSEAREGEDASVRRPRHHHRHGRNRHGDCASSSVASSADDAAGDVSDEQQGGKPQGKDATLKIAELVSKVKELEEKCKSLEDEKTDLFNKMLLVKADGENYRKRLEKDKEETVRLANKGIVSDLLPGLDSIDVALASISDEGIRQGIEMIRSSFLSSLGKWGLQMISPIDKEFDPMECEACMFEEREGIDKEIVIEVLQAGYLLHGKVVRPAKVKIAKPV